jgi:hypothetical protein
MFQVEASTMAVTVREYETADGKAPFRGWLNTLDRITRAWVRARVIRFETGTWATTRPSGTACRRPE